MARWKGNLNSPKSIAGLNELKKDVLALSRADKTGTEADEWTTFSQGHVASMIGNGWEVGLITDPKAGAPALAPVVSAFPMPSHVKGRVMPSFLARLRSGRPGVDDAQVAGRRLDQVLHLDDVRAAPRVRRSA